MQAFRLAQESVCGGGGTGIETRCSQVRLNASLIVLSIVRSNVPSNVLSNVQSNVPSNVPSNFPPNGPISPLRYAARAFGQTPLRMFHRTFGQMFLRLSHRSPKTSCPAVHGRRQALLVPLGRRRRVAVALRDPASRAAGPLVGVRPSGFVPYVCAHF